MLWDEPKIFFLERRYFFSIILSEFLKNRVALQEGHNVSVDGHTRLFVAAEKGIQNVYGFYTEAGDYVRDFAAEAIRRNIVSPYQLIEVKHEDYEKLWFAFCDEYFSSK